MRRLKICYICKTWCPDGINVNGCMLCPPCWGDVVSETYRRVHGTHALRTGGVGEPVVATLGEGPDNPTPPVEHGTQLELML